MPIPGRLRDRRRGTWMSKPTRGFCLLVAALSACVMVGLYIHYRYVTASLVHEAQQQAWSDLAKAGDCVLAELDSLKRADAGWGDEDVVRLLTSLQHAEALRTCHATYVNANGDVLFSSCAGDIGAQQGQIGNLAGVWHEVPGDSRGAGGAVRGSLLLPQGRHLGLVYAIRADGSHVLVHRSDAVDVSHPVIRRTLLIAGIMTLLWSCGVMGIAAYLILTPTYGLLRRENERVEARSLEQIQDLVRTRDAVILGLAKLADSRDPETGDHLDRMSLYASTLALALTREPQYRHVVTPAFVRLIEVSSGLHDIGKVGVPDAILRKPGALTDDERLTMQTHTTIGGQCLQNIERRLGSSNFLQMAREIAMCHHERWDGTGYPIGSAGEQIPLAARIVAIADAYDAMSAGRVYNAARPHERCEAVIRAEAGKQFDPSLVAVFLKVERRFGEIARQYGSIAELPPDAVDSPGQDRSQSETEADARVLVPQPV